MVKSEKEDSSASLDTDLLVSFSAGDAIYSQGDAGTEMFIIEDGKVEIVHRYGPTERQTAVLEAGDFFGEMTVLEEMPRNATARALEPSRLLPVDSAAFDQMLRDHPELVLRMMRKLGSRLREQEEEAERAYRAAAGVLSGAAVPTGAVGVSDTPADGGVGAQQPGSATTSSAISLRLLHRASGSSFALEPGSRNLVGRRDPVTRTIPEIDLSLIDEQRTLSRRHARIWCEGDKVFVQEEMGAANGTFVENRRLVPGQSQVIENGTKLRFGLVELVLEATEKE